MTLAYSTGLVLLGIALAQPSTVELTRRIEDSVRNLTDILDNADWTSAERSQVGTARRDFGDRSRELADVLKVVVRVRVHDRNLAASTLDLAFAAVSLRTELFGPDDPTLADELLNDLAYLLSTASDLEDALEAYRWSLRIEEQTYGRGSLRTVSSLAGAGGVMMDLGELEEGVALLRRSIDIAERHLSPVHPDVANGLFSLAVFLYESGRYDEAIAHWKRTAQIFETPPYQDEEEVARSIHNIGAALHRLGRINEAEEQLETALRMRLENQSHDERSKRRIASTYGALGALLHDRGRLSRARQLYLNALDGFRDWFGEDSFRYAHALTLLGTLAEESGDVARAQALHRQSLELRLEKLGPEDRRVARSRSAFGAFLARTVDLAGAEVELREAARVQEATVGEEHPDYGRTLVAMAYVERQRGEIGAAIRLVERGIEIIERMSSSDPDLIEAYTELAICLRMASRNEQASKVIERGSSLVASTLGTSSHRSVGFQIERALLLQREGRFRAAMREALGAEAIARRHALASIYALPEHQALRFVDAQRSALALTLSLLGELEGEPELTREVWDRVVRSRSLVLDSLVVRARTVHAETDAKLRGFALELVEAHRHQAALLVRGVSDLHGETRERLNEEARKTTSRAERALAEASLPFLRDLERREIGLDLATRGIPSGSALVAISQYRHPSSTDVEDSRYVAFVLAADATATTVVPLGSATKLDDLVAEWRSSIARGRGSDDSTHALGQRLRSTLWDPVEPHVRGAERVFLVPDGSVNLVNLGALKTSDGDYLIEDVPLVHMLTTERELARPTPRASSPGGLLALGGPDYNLARARVVPRETDQAYSVSPWRSACAAPAAGSFLPLPAAAREVEEIARLWTTTSNNRDGPALVLTGRDAVEESVKELAPDYRILHFATHGFSFRPECQARAGFRTRQGGAPPTLSGLAFAGANRLGGAQGPEDGMFTTFEIGSMDLSRVEWVVLSACDTGVGEVRPGEGTFGLRRSFIVAGARTLIMSLWSVEDESTRAWMESLYRARLIDGLDTAEAVRSASLQMLRSRRAKGESTHPVHWAAFVASGDWR